MRLARRGLTWVECLVIALILLILAALLFPFVAQRKTDGPIPCLSNAKQLALAAILYAEDFDGRLMPRDSWMDADYPYLKNWSIFHCPDLHDPVNGFPGLNPGTVFGYAFNSSLSLKDMKTVPRLESTPLIYDSVNLAKNASDPFASLPIPPRKTPRGPRNSVAFADGHVTYFKEGARVPQ